MSESAPLIFKANHERIQELENRIEKATKFLDKVCDKEVTAFAYLTLKTILTQSVPETESGKS